MMTSRRSRSARTHRTHRRAKHLPRQRGVVLLAVLLIIVLASLVGTTVLIVADADRAGAEVSLRRTQSRALAWSGVQAVMAELANQREELLDGRKPRVTEEWTLVGDERDEVRGVFRLIPLSLDGPLASESARLDLNSATPEMLARLPGVGPDLAELIVAARDRVPFASVEGLLEVEGVGAEMLFGPPEGDGPGPGEGWAQGAPPLASLVTVFGFDPNVQLGLGPTGFGHRGELRLNINTPWSERLERALADRFGQDFAGGVKGIMESRQFRKDSDLAAILIDFGVDPAEWLQTFDVFTTSPDPYLPGRVDLNTAPAEVLAAVPGIDEAAAGRIVGMRGQLSEDLLRSVTWPVVEGVLTPEQFQSAADWITTRSMQWRVRVEAGFESAEQASESSASDARKLRDRIVLEAVIDVASERPRVAYLREVTLLDPARRALARSGEDGGEASERDTANRGAEAAPPADEDVGAEGPPPPSRLGRVPSRLIAAEEHLNERLGLGVAEDLDDGFDAEVAESEAALQNAEAPEPGQDRRIGRWNPAGGSQGGRR
jgi:DNA uptake protein ComE-like DNA-binding protein